MGSGAGRCLWRTGPAVALACVLGCDEGSVLAPEQRRAYLEHYAPIVLKQTDENQSARLGRDWISNFHFDGDQVFANNIDSAKQLVDFATDPGFAPWQIRPTLYTAFIEFGEFGRKGALLLYHVYHFMQQADVPLLGSARSIHDWERIEIRLDDVGPVPGGRERIRYVAITRHGLHDARTQVGPFQEGPEAADGRHLVVYQAKAIGDVDGLYANELRFVGDEWSAIRDLRDQDSAACGTCKSKVTLENGSTHSFQYVFVPESDARAVHYWGAREINPLNAWDLAARDRNGPIRMEKVQRITYELQDLADLIPGMRNDGTPNPSWRETEDAPQVPVLMERPLVAFDGTSLVPTGLHFFFPAAREQGDADDSGLLDFFGSDDKRSGFVWKSWFWGAYSWDRDQGGFKREALEEGGPGGSRCAANGIPACQGFFWQHDYFLHDGVRGDGSFAGEVGGWLAADWYTRVRGGFDGRWVQLFDDDAPPRPKLWLASDRSQVAVGEPLGLAVRASALGVLASVRWHARDARDPDRPVSAWVDGVQVDLGAWRDLGHCAGSYECSFERDVAFDEPGLYTFVADAEDAAGASAWERRGRFALLGVEVAE